jgi:hypothetical protein
MNRIVALLVLSLVMGITTAMAADKGPFRVYETGPHQYQIGRIGSKPDSKIYIAKSQAQAEANRLNKGNKHAEKVDKRHEEKLEEKPFRVYETGSHQYQIGRIGSKPDSKIYIAKSQAQAEANRLNKGNKHAVKVDKKH